MLLLTRHHFLLKDLTHTQKKDLTTGQSHQLAVNGFSAGYSWSIVARRCLPLIILPYAP